jgi:glyoxylase-like metal-dependent hydrolase (beta-lactamase superfamily II)
MSVELRVGQLTMIGLRDGDFIMPVDFLGDPLAHQQLAGPDGQVRLPIGCFLVPGDAPVLIDAGIGPDLKVDIMTGGGLLDELALVGVRPDQIEHLALSHLHADHIGWIATKGGGVVFPNAQVYVAESDWQHFLVDDHDPKPVPWVRAALFDLAEQGRVTLLDRETQVVPGVTALPAPGHTPGHTVYVIHHDGERAVLLGDAIYCPQQLTEVDWEAASDVDPALARRTRERLWREVEQRGGLAVGPHFPGLRAGRVLGSTWVGLDS